MTAYDFMTGILRALTAKGDLLVRKAVGVERLPVGLDGEVLSSDANSRLGIAWQRPGMGGPPQYVSSRWYTGAMGGGFATSTSSSSGAVAYVTPFHVTRRTTFTDIGIHVASVTTATSFRMAVYSGVPVIGNTMQKIAGSDGEVTSITTSALNSAAFSQPLTLDKGWYGLLFFPNGGITVNSLNNGLLTQMTGSTDMNATQPKMGAAGQTYGVLDSVAMTILNESSTNFAVGLRAQ